MKRYKFQSEVPKDFHGQCYITAFFPDTPATVWYEHGIEHRLDGPALVHDDGSEFWRRHGLTHRLDGPAAIWSNESYIKEYRGMKIYYLHDEQFSEEEYWQHPLVQEHKLRRILNPSLDV